MIILTTMARYVIKTKDDIRELLDKDIQVGDVIDHKGFDPPVFAGELKKVFPESEIFTATIGTDIFAKYGVNVSMITKLTNE